MTTRETCPSTDTPTGSATPSLGLDPEAGWIPDAEPTGDADPETAWNYEETEELGDRIAELSAQIQAATYHLLVMIREFDRRHGWHEAGFKTCAHWLHWRTGLSLGAAREKVRVARALEDLPVISESMRRGKLSYSKVRALTRVARAEDEKELLTFASAGTTAHVETLVRAWRRLDKQEEADRDEMRRVTRELTAYTDSDGMVVVRGRLDPETGAVFLKALEAAADRLYEEAKSESGENGDNLDGEEITPEQRRADAVGLIAESALAHELDPGTRGDRYQVVVHVDQEVLARSSWNASRDPESECCARDDAMIEGESRSEAADGVSADGSPRPAPSKDIPAGTPPANQPGASSFPAPSVPGISMLEPSTDISAGTARRIACDCSKVEMTHGPDGSILDVGRKTRTIPTPIRRALAFRDRCCRFPGCQSTFCEAHHVEHWADGGETKLENLLFLCRAHHTAVHERGFRVELEASGVVRFYRPDGRTLPAAPPPPPVGDDPVSDVLERLEDDGTEITPFTAQPDDSSSPDWGPVLYNDALEYFRG